MFSESSNYLKAGLVSCKMLTAYARDNKPESVSTRASWFTVINFLDSRVGDSFFMYKSKLLSQLSRVLQSMPPLLKQS